MRTGIRFDGRGHAIGIQYRPVAIGVTDSGSCFEPVLCSPELIVERSSLSAKLEVRSLGRMEHLDTEVNVPSPKGR